MEIKNTKETRNIIEDIILGSIADEMGIEPGDILISINDQKIKDVIDYKYLVADESLFFEVEKGNGEIWELEVEKDYDEDLGIIFTNPLIDRAKTCQNKCMFCFIDQLPPNMRDTLYFKDDDSRLSFLQGNFITLTNMSDDDINRIINYRLSPINISVHTTNPELRVKMLKNKNAGKVFEILKRFHNANLKINCQIVLVPNVNDKTELENTINDLSTLYPSVASVAVVPVGITKYRKGLEKLDVFDKSLSKELVQQIENMQHKYLIQLGTRFVFASDEFFCVSEEPLPDFDEYEGFPQYENGVGLLRSFKTEIEQRLERQKEIESFTNKIIFATGTLAFDFILEISKLIMSKCINLEIRVIPIKNKFFGETITVSGLITGSDLVEQLSNLDDYDYVLIPDSMLKNGEDIFLDNISLMKAAEMLNKKIHSTPVDGDKLIDIIEYGVEQ